VGAYLTDLEQLGVFDGAAALLFARPYGYTAADADILWEVVAARTEAAGLPVLANVEVGHTDPLLTVPIGRPARLSVDERWLELLEPPTAG
jgi:muramoyltetrapeptide carboxypeptidase LdcA involved in peptidoglycan recycling